MKLSIVAGFALLVTLAIISCKKGDIGPAGPEGPQGLQGPQGPTGVAGNANVMQYTFGVTNFVTTASVNLQATTTADTMNRSAWFIYLVRSSGNVYPIPGFGVNGTSEYRAYWSHSGGKANFTITKVSGTGEEYANIRIIRIYANTALRSGQSAQLPAGIDFRDYHAVCEYYGIPN